MDLTVASRCGADRTASQDRWLTLAGRGGGALLAVADGMGGTVGGGAAAGAALAALVEALTGRPPPGNPQLDLGRSLELRWPGGGGSGGAMAMLAEAVTAAHHRVHALAADGLPAALRGGTTLTAVVASGRRLHLAHAGDSSCWLLRRGRVRRLTEVHTYAAALVAAGAIEPGSSAEHRLDCLLTRYLGMPGAVHPQLVEVPARPGDRVLVVTDGITRALTVAALGALLARPGVVAAELVEAAVDAGGRDDATALLGTVDTGVGTTDTRYGDRHGDRGGAGRVTGTVRDPAGRGPRRPARAPEGAGAGKRPVDRIRSGG